MNRFDYEKGYYIFDEEPKYKIGQYIKIRTTLKNSKHNVILEKDIVFVILSISVIKHNHSITDPTYHYVYGYGFCKNEFLVDERPYNHQINWVEENDIVLVEPKDYSCL